VPTYSYPSNAELREVSREYISLLSGTDNPNTDPIFRHFAIRTVDADTVIWEQGRNVSGLQQYRGAGGEFPPVATIGSDRYVVTPGYYGEKSVIFETDILRMRRPATFADTTDITTLVRDRVEQLAQREIDRMRNIGWTLATTGTFSVTGQDGVNAVHQDTYSTQSIAFSDWSDVANATPIADMRRMKLLQRGSGVMFNATSRAYANQVTINYLLNNRNANDLGGKLIVNGNNIITLADINRVLSENDLPQIFTYDDGYLTTPDPASFVPFIGDDKLVVFGSRMDGEPVAAFEQTINAQTGSPGPDVAVVETDYPKAVTVYRSVNYAPTIQHVRAIVWATC
jgi:hypothetical protein